MPIRALAKVLPASQLLTLAGLALFGEHWKNPLSRALDVKRDTLDDWFADRLEVPSGVWVDIAVLLRERQVASAAALAALSDLDPPPAPPTS